MVEPIRAFAPETPEYKEFFRAVLAGSLEYVQSTLKPGMDVNLLMFTEEDDGCDCHGDHGIDSRRYGGETALHVAAHKNYLSIVDFLIDNGADVNSLDRNNCRASECTPIHCAARRCHIDMMKLLIRRGADVSVFGSPDGAAIHNVVFDEGNILPRHVEAIELLLDNGADVNVISELTACSIVS
jgi:ankyrin repeat protein